MRFNICFTNNVKTKFIAEVQESWIIGIVRGADRIEIPAFIPFDRLEIQTEDEDCSVSCDIALDNGYIHPAAHDVMTNLEMQLAEEIPGAVDNHYKSGDDDQFYSFWHHYVIDRNEFKREGDMMVHILKEVHFSVHNVVDKDICIDLKDIAEYE